MKRPFTSIGPGPRLSVGHNLEAANLAVVLGASQADSQPQPQPQPQSQQPAEPAARRGSEAKPAPQPAHKVIAGPTVGGVQLVRAYSGNYVRGDAEKVGLLPLDACWEAEQAAAHAVAFDQPPALPRTTRTARTGRTASCSRWPAARRNLR